MIFRFQRYINIHVLPILIFFLSCQKAEKPQPDGVLRLPGGNVYGLDPARDSEFTGSVFIMDRIYSPVYRSEHDPANLADSVSHDSTGKVWTIYLKKNLHFQDDPCFTSKKEGEITAYDVEFSWMRAKNPPYLVAPVVKQIQKVDIVDRYVLNVILNVPNLLFLNELGREEFFIVSKRAVEYYGGDFRHHPVGSGPFRLGDLSPGQIILTRNDNFWVQDEFGQQLPYLEGIVFEFDPDPVSRYRKLLSGNFDMINLGQINSPLVVEINKEDHSFTLIDTLKNEGYKLIEGKVVWLLHFMNPLRDNPLIGQALNWAIDRERIQQKGLSRNGIPAGGPLFESLCPGCETYGYDPEKAKVLLAQAGYPGGKGFPTLLFSASPASVPLYSEIKEYLGEIGIKTDIAIESQLQSFGAEKTRNTWFTLYTAWNDPMDQLLIYQSRYYLHINDDVFDSLYDSAEREPDEEKRLDMIQQMEQIVLGEAPAIFLFWFKSFYITKNHVMNLNPNRFGVWEGTWIKR